MLMCHHTTNEARIQQTSNFNYIDRHLIQKDRANKGIQGRHFSVTEKATVYLYQTNQIVNKCIPTSSPLNQNFYIVRRSINNEAYQ